MVLILEFERNFGGSEVLPIRAGLPKATEFTAVGVVNVQTVFATTRESNGSDELEQLGSIGPNDLEFEFAYCLSRQGGCFKWLDQRE
ncbi:hypothetical protein A5746_31295 [Mycolicibacterium conceptionense]|nr:hypothetical protein A5746_31295 [Mycolicibacterium conceptionense]